LYELANGCLCCTVQEEFAPVMEQLAARRDQIDHLIIETSGLALPKPLVQAFQWPALRNTFTVDAVVTVVDAPAVAAGRLRRRPGGVDAQRRADDNLDHDSPLRSCLKTSSPPPTWWWCTRRTGSTRRRWPAWRPPSAPRPRPA
jgi:cobalamin biosynthesis protein CobW